MSVNYVNTQVSHSQVDMSMPESYYNNIELYGVYSLDQVAQKLNNSWIHKKTVGPQAYFYSGNLNIL